MSRIKTDDRGSCGSGNADLKSLSFAAAQQHQYPCSVSAVFTFTQPNRFTRSFTPSAVRLLNSDCSRFKLVPAGSFTRYS